MPEAASTIRLGKPTTPPTPPCDLWPGDILARRYRLEALVGWGGQAVVFQATDLRPRKPGNPTTVAIKIVRTDLPSGERQEAGAVLRWEARLLRKLHHPALPRLVHFHDGNPGMWLVRELVPGQSLAEIAGRGPCSARTIQPWIIQLCDLLSYLHTQSPPLICGDIKPSNLVLRPDGKLVLIDLGAALPYTPHASRRSRPRHGTPGYAPPEQLGKQEVDERSDLFSLGVTCYELLTGVDPAEAPLQFDLQRLNLVAPLLAPALRWALTLDQARRPPTAAVLRSALATPAAPRPLQLGRGIQVTNQYDLLRTAVRAPQLVDTALSSGTLDRWLALHPDRAMGKLLHDLRAARRRAPARQRPLDAFLTTLAPANGSALLRARPERIRFGHIPLRQWRVWSRPQRLSIHNASAHPQTWELECPAQKSAEVRVLVDGRPLRRHGGVLPPGGRVEVELVAAGRTGKQQGSLKLRCGAYTTDVAWEATAVAMLPLGPQFVTYLNELNLSQPDLVPLLEDSLRRGVLQRWLRAQGERRLAAELTAATKPPAPDATTLRLLAGRVLHHLAPSRFPMLHLHGSAPSGLQVTAGDQTHYTIQIENLGEYACKIDWRSSCAWVRVAHAEKVIPPQACLPCTVTLAPPTTLPSGEQQVALELRAGDLVVPLSVTVQVVTESWWARMFRWFVGS